MQLYYHPASTTSRMVMLFAAEQKIPLEMKVIDIFTGEHQGAAFKKVNPSGIIPKGTPAPYLEQPELRRSL